MEQDPREVELFSLLKQEIAKGVKFPWFRIRPEEDKVSICSWCQLSPASEEEQQEVQKGNAILSKLAEQVGLEPSHGVCPNCQGKVAENKIMFKNILKLSNKEKIHILFQYGNYDEDGFYDDVLAFQNNIEKKFGKIVIWDTILSPTEYYERNIDEYSKEYNENFSPQDFLSGYYIELANAVGEGKISPLGVDQRFVKDLPIFMGDLNSIYVKLESFVKQLVNNLPGPTQNFDSKPIKSKRLEDKERVYDPREDAYEYEADWERDLK